MKYIAILVVIILFVRIDVLLEYFDKITGNARPAPQEINANDIKVEVQNIPLAQDKNLAQSPRGKFFALLEAFRASPEASVRESAIGHLRLNPTLFSEKLDKDLEAQIFRWRDLLVNNEAEAVNFILDLNKILRGENHQMLLKFFSIWMEINMENFIAAYIRTGDINCEIATTIGDNIPDEEKINIFYDRETELKKMLVKEGIAPLHRTLAENCLNVLTSRIDEIDGATP
jgi:hypothetical protein